MRISGHSLFFLFLFFFFTSNSIFSEKDSIQKTVSEKQNATGSNDIRTGERLFYGLIPSAAKTLNCAACHNTVPIDTFNWNPSALDLAKKYSGKDFETFKKALMQPSGNLMGQLHDGIQFNDLQIRQIKGYLNYLYLKGVIIKPLLTNRILFIVLVLVLLLAFIDFSLTHYIKYKIIPVIVILLAVVFITNYLVTSAIDIGRSPRYQPDQPIKFSHAVHAGQNKTSCVYCHFDAEQSKFAGIPPASICMSCHQIVKEGSRSGKFEIDKIAQAIKINRPIEWIKVHNLPDHVFFSHAQHVVAGKLECVQCHGDVPHMDQIIQVKDLSMGWCVNCHRETNVQFDNKFYGKYAQLHKDLREGKITKVTADKIGSTDCMKCHY